MTTSEQNLAYFNRNPKEYLHRFVTMDETWIHHYARESREGFWDAHGVIFIDYLEKGKTITRAYYVALLLFFMVTMHHLTHRTLHRQKSMNWVSNRFRIHSILQIWPPATIICSQISRDGFMVGVLSRTKKLNGKQKGILEGLTNPIIWKA